MEYICKKHQNKGVQKITYDHFHNRNQGCKYCGIEHVNTFDKHNKTTENEIISFLEQYDNIQYCGMEFINGRCYVKYICMKHPNAHIQIRPKNAIMRRKFICYECYKDSLKLSDFNQKIHDKNPNLEVLSEYNGYNSIVSCFCKTCEYTWEIKAGVLLEHCTCPRCRKAISESEKIVASILSKYKFNYEPQKRFLDCINIRPLPFDFYLSDYNCCIEFDGEHHYKIIQRSNKNEDELIRELQNIQRNDLIKTNYCNKNNIVLIRIPYWERNHMESFLLQKFKDNNIPINNDIYKNP